MDADFDATKWSFGAGIDYFSWPIARFIQIFSGFGEKDEDDWKAAVYKWGGPKPSLIESTRLSVEGGVAKLHWYPKAGVTGVYDHTTWGGVRWSKGVPPASEQCDVSHSTGGEGDRGATRDDKGETSTTEYIT